MNKKEILLICLIICFIFSLQAVSAADVDVNTTDDTILTVQTDDAVSTSNDLSSYSLSDDDSIVRGENDGAGSFSELQERINNDTTGTISLDKNYTYNASSDAGLTNGIVISKDIAIKGNDFTIDAISSARIFNITTGSTVTLTGINFVNGGSTSVINGGSIYTSAEGLTVDNCTFKNSYAAKDGGAIYVNADHCTVANSTFTDNIAGDDGGALCWNGDDGTIYNITCVNNKGISSDGSTSKGGSICLTGDDVTVDKSTFTDSFATYNGGALFITGDNVNITNCDFSSCTSDVTATPDGDDLPYGGAMYIIGNNALVDTCTFDECEAINGGAIYVLGDSATINNSTFTSDEATKDGGAIYIDGEKCIVHNSTFTDNIVGDDGGAIYWNGAQGSIYNITCTNNRGISSGTSTSKGGSICLTGDDVSVDKSTFTDSFATYNGGALFITGDNVNITNCDFSSCTSDVTATPDGDDLPYGGAMYIIGNNALVDTCTFDECEAINGGAIYVLGDSATINNSTFTNGETTKDGGAIYIDGEKCIVHNSTFTDNVAGDDGGAIYWNGAQGSIYNITCTNNRGISSGTSTSKGGSICLTGDDTVIDMSTFSDSFATYNGGALFITGDNVNITNCNFSSCTSDTSATPSGDDLPYGGAMYIIGSDTLVDTCTFEDCEAINGGTVYITGDRATIKNSNISDSTAKVGGAIYIDGVDTTIIDSSFKDNYAKSGSSYTTDNLGGAIYIKGNRATINGSEFESSGAYQGGAIYLAGDYCTVNASTFNDSYAYLDGGAMYSTGSYSNVTDSNFTSNIARGNGGAIYWYGGTKSKYNTVDGCMFLENVVYAANFASNTRGGGAVYWSDNGDHGTIKNSQFINNSVQSSDKADGGAILWDRSNHALIDNCVFDGNYITTSNSGNVWVQGGALYLRADSEFIINNSVFKNSVSDKEAGALYAQTKNGLTDRIIINNTSFINNVAKAFGQNSFGGGAVQVKECDNVHFYNVLFINNTANNGGAVSAYKARTNIDFYNCTFEGNNATDNGGAVWTDSAIDLQDDEFYNNTANLGGGFYVNKNNLNIHDLTFINNTAELGGGIYIAQGGTSLTNLNMTDNKAFSGSAIYSTTTFKIINSYLIENQANSSSLTFDTYNEETGEIVILFKGKDKYLNAIYVTNSNRPTCTNVTYWNENGKANTGSSATTLPNAVDPTPEAGQNITVRVYDDAGNLLNPDQQYFITDKYGKIHLDLHDLVPNVPADKYNEIYIEAELTNDDYYTIIKLTSRLPSEINASADKTKYHLNSTVYVNVTSGATGNVSVYLNDTFLGNITLDHSTGSMNISTLIEGKYLPAGNHTLSFIYNGNAKYDKSNTTAILEIEKITPTILINVTSLGYNLIVNVTVMDGEYGIADATGNVTIQVEGRTATIYLGNSQGMTIIYGLPSGNYTVNATYNGDNNYYNVTNSTYANITEKTITALVIEVDNEKIYYINETVPIKVNILPEGEGNITLYINGEPHVLPLKTVNNETFAEFNATELKDGTNYIFATYNGTELYAPSWDEDHFNVIKYNSTVLINTTNITRGETEVIDITVPDDATGILNVTVNGTSYFVEIIDGTASVPISGLNVGVYNVTVRFNEDKKYYNSTNSTLFNVSQAKPTIIIDVDNVTYGNETVIVVTLPEDATGNVTVKINDTYYVFDTQNLTDGKAIMPGIILPAGNYTVEATYNGDENYTVNSNSTNFTVYKAEPVLNITVEDIYYGEEANITVTVPDGVTGDITIKINGTDKNITLPIADGKVNWTVGGLAVGNYVVIANYSGNANYTNATVTDDFNVLQIGTVLDVAVHDIPVWDTEYINITIKDTAGNIITNATGNVTININGVNHTAEIKDGIARFNTSDLAVGHKVAWVFYDGDRNLTGNRSMAEFDVTQRDPKVNVTALNVTVDQATTITINIPSNATGFVVLSGNFTKRPIYVDADEFTNGVAEIPVDGLAVGTYSVHIKYYGDALDNYTVAENDTTFTVGKINATVSIEADNVTYGNATTIVVTVPEGVTGNITLKLNDTAGRNITLPIESGKVTWVVEGLAAGNYTVNATYNGNDYYNINNTESAKFEVKKADPALEFIVSGTVHDNATVQIYINDEIHGKVVNVTVDGVPYTNVSVDEEFITQVLNEIKPYTIIVEYGGNENFTSARVEQTFTPSKVTNYGINVTAMNITVGEDEIITVEVPDNVDDVVIWVDGRSYRNNSFTDNKATFNITGLKEGIYTVTAKVNDTEFEHDKNFTTLFTVNKTYPSINITVVNETSIYVNDTVKVIVTVPKDVTENVTIEINGMEFTNSTVNGNATFYIPEITFGNKTVVATYPGDNKYRFNSTTANFTVNKRKSQVNVTVDAGVVGDDTVINVTIPANATGYVIVNVDGTNYTVNTTNGNGSITIKDLGNTTHTVYVTYIGDDQYLPSENETTFGIPKDNTTIAIAVQDINYGESANITVTVKDDATGYITIRIDNIRNITLPIVNGTVNWIVNNLPADNYTVVANYSGDGKYNVNETNGTFEVRQISPEIEIISVISTADDNATIIVKVDPRVSENVTVNVDNKDYTAKPVNGIAIITTDVLDYGDYTINASYAGDKNFTKDYDIYEFTTNQTDDYLINITASDIHVGDNTNITVYVPSDATGKVIIELNGTKYNATIAEGKAVLDNVSTLEEGVYNVTAYFGDDKYANKTVETRFAVSKVDTPIAITIVNDTSILVNDTVKVIVTVPEDATEDVTIEINGMEFTNSTVDGNATFYVPSITYGNKTVVATYPGDGKYRFNSTTANFTVNKRELDMKVDVTEVISVGDVAQVNVTLPTNATGHVVVEVDGQNYTINLTDGKGSVGIKGLLNGTYPVEATYLGDDQYLSRSNSTQEIKVNKVPSSINVTVADITLGDVAAVNITVITNATGNVTIVIGNEFNKTVGVIDGEFSVIVPGLTVGDKIVNVTYNGDDRFLPSENSANFTVGKTTTEITLAVQNITYGDVETIVAFINATGNVTIIVDGEVIATPDIVEGKVIYDIPGLNAGNYTVEVIYNGDSDTNSTSAKANFTVFKADVELEISVQDIPYGDVEHIIVTVKAKGNAQGNVTITVAGNTTTIVLGEEETWVLKAPADDVVGDYTGEAKWNIYNLAVGTYPVTATYNGNENFNPLTADDSFIVYQINTTLDVDVHDILVWDKESINVTLAKNTTGNVTININGEDHTVPITNGTAQLNLTNLTVGHKVVWVFYDGDKNYTANRTMVEFDVGQRDPKVNVTALNITVGQEGKITINIPANATGYVVLDGNFTENLIHVDEFTDGVAEITVSGLANGTYSVHIKYYGDALDNYTIAENDTTFTVSKENTTIAIAVESIDYGEKANITVTVEDDATGYITITIDGFDDITLPVVNGTVNWIVDNLPADNYTVIANYSGDGKYNKNDTTGTFEVRQISPEIEIISVISTADDNATIIVKVDPRVSENVTVTVDNKDYTAKPVNGIAVITTNVLDYGNYTVNASYAGDKNFTKDNATYKFTTNQTDDYLINITASDIHVGDNTNITVYVPSDATGKVIIVLNGTNYTATIAEGKAVLDNVSIRKEGVYNVTAYFGDDKYANKTVKTRFAVSKVDTPIAITVVNETSILVNDTVKVIVTVPENVTEDVTIEINGMKFTNSTVDGNATFYVPSITYGNKTVVATYPGDDKYRFNSTTANFTVNKRELDMKVDVTEVINVGDVAQVNVTLPENATGHVVVKVDGQNYTINLTDGKGSVEVKGLLNGTYPVEVTYLGDDQYLSRINNTQEIKVNKVHSFINITVSEDGIITNGSDVDIFIKAPSDVTGKVNVTIYDVEKGINTTYVVYVNEGEGKLHLDDPIVGVYNVTAIYLENEKYLESENYTTFEVYDNEKELVVQSRDGVYVNETNIVFVILSGNHTGDYLTVIITNASGEVIRNESVLITDYYSQPFNFSSADWQLPLLDAGHYEIKAIYTEVDGAKTIVHEGNSSFDVWKLGSEIKIKEIKNISFGENATIELEIELDSRADDGNISVFVDGKEYVTNTSTLKITVPDLGAGNYTVEAFYYGNRWYNESNATSAFRVDKNDVPISINVTNSNVGEVEQINVTVGNNATGYVIVDVDGQQYHANITDGVAQVNITGLKAGEHNVTAIYVENGNFLGNSTNATLTVSKVPSTVIVTVDNITVGDVAVVNITVITNATGNVTITIGDEYNKTVGVTDGVISVIVPGLTVGDKTVNVTYNGDDRFLPNENSTTFTVGKTTAEIDLVVQNITYGEVETVIAFINATGNVTIKLGDKTLDTVNIADGKVEYDIDKLPAGNYTVELIYNGDTNTNSTSIKANFTVAKADPVITVEVEDIPYGDVEHIIIHSNAEGNVTVKLNGQTIVVELTLENGNTAVLMASRWDIPEYNGNATVNVSNLAVGKYDVEATFNGNENYNAATAADDFYVYKANTTVSIDVKPVVTVGETQVMNITINNTNATGNVTINIDGENYTTPITNGTGNFTIPPLASGNHSIVVIYEGDKNLTGNWTSATFEVEKLNITVDLDATSPIIVGSPVTFTATLNETVTGDVVFTINDANYTVHVSNADVATYTYTPINNDTLEVVATFMGNDEYNANSTSGNFTVGKVSTSIFISVDEPIAYGEAAHVSIELDPSINAIVELVVDDKSYYVAVVDGKGEFNVSGLSTGGHVANVTFNGDDKYLGSNSSTTFTVSRANINETDIKVIDQGNGTVVVVVPDNATGNVTIKVGNNTYNATVENGMAIINLENETPGVHDIEVIYSGDDNYAPANTTGTATIPKLATPIDVTVENIKVGDKENIVVTVPDNATGNVTIEIDGVKYTEEIKDGNATFEIENLTAGNKTVAVDYIGDDNYLGNHTTANFTVSKVTPEIKMNVTVDGDTVTIDVEVPDDATKTVLIDFDGIGIYVNLTDGKGQLKLTNLTGGSHDVRARYPGDDKYTESNVVNDTFDVENLPSNVTVKVENITYGDDAVIEVTVPEDATGNVTVTIDGKPYQANVSGGKAIVVVPGLEAGNHTVDVTYNGDDKYVPSNTSTVLEVSKAPTDELIVIDQGNGTVVVVVPDNATGNVTITVGNNTYNATVENGVATITLDNETPGTHDIEVIYSGDENHEGTNTTSTVTIPKLETPISVDVDNINVGDTAVITVNLPDNATGNVTIEIDGVKYTEEIKDGKAVFNVTNLTAGNKTVAVDYIGDDNYLGNHTTANFTVSKVTPKIKMNTTLDGDTVTIEVEVPEDATKTVLIDVDGRGYYVNITDGKGRLVLENLTGGSHDAKARYPGDDKYTESVVVNDTFNVENLPSNVTVKVENITYGDDAVIEVTVPEDATGNVTVTIDGKPYQANVSGGKAIVVVPGLEAGNHTVDVTYNGDDKYVPSNTSTVLEVSKAPTDEPIVIDQGNGTVVVVVPDNATGNVTIKVGNNTYTAEVVNGTAVITLDNETPGTHDIEVIYSGDENHEGTNTTSTVTIPKVETPISVDVDDCKVGDTAVVTVNVPKDATGNVTIEVDGVKYTEEIKNGKAVFNVTNLTDGNKTVAVDYPGDDTYLGNHTTGNFTVDKCPSTVEAVADPIDAGETAVIEVTVPEDATGYVIVEIDNQTYACEIVNGTATVEIEGLGGGDYPINVIYPGDDKYAPSNSSTSLKVSKVPSTVNVTVDDITVGDKAVINVETPEDVCGNVTVSVDGQNYTVFVSGGKGTLVVPDLDVGPHTVDVIFDGCKKYEPSNNTAQFNVNKVNTTEDEIKVIDQGNGTVVVVVPDNANGTVEIKVGNNTYNATVENGVATITLDNETPGTHDIEVIYSGDDTHEGANTTSTVTIPKVETPISVDVDDCKVGDTAVITVNVPKDATGNVTIEVEGVKYTSEIKDGKAVFNVTNLTDGNKTIAVDYIGDDTYLGNHTTGKFTVSKRESYVSATIDDSNVGDNVTVTVTVPEDATGQVLIDIDGVGYYVNVTNGTGTVEIPRVPSGVYDVSVTYPGDDKYLPSSNNTTCKVNKVESFVIPKAEDIYVGDNEVITFSVPKDATGNVTIVIDGKEYNFNIDDGRLSGSEEDGVFTVAVSGGNGKVVISGLPKGDYVVSAKYNGDDKYLPSTNSTTFKVLRKSTDMEVTDLGNGTVVVDLPDNATGTVTIVVGNNTYNATVENGKAVVDLSNETPGTHDIKVKYSGDNTHEPITEDSKVTIPKHDTPISVEVDDCKVGDTAVVTVTLPDDATGNVTIEINGKSYTTEVKNGKAVFKVTGLAAGDKTVAVKYDGDNNYVENSTTGQFTVSKRPSTVSATGKDINVGKDEVITVTVPKDATGRVLVDIDGVGYYGTIVNGKAKVIIPELPSGKYTAKVTYEGDDKYLPSTTNVKFTVTKVKTPIKATGDEIDQGQEATVVVRVPSDATGTVTITVDGKKYTTEVKEGKAVFSIPGLTKGDHEVTASYSGDKKYEANDTITDIEVHYSETPSGEDNVKHAGVDLTQHATGNPILVLLLVILAIGSTQIRRFRK